MNSRVSRNEKRGNSKDSWRVFCAIELPAEVRSALEKHIKAVREAVPDYRASWSRVENIHLTLKFFGQVPVGRIAEISEAAAIVARDFDPFEIAVTGTGAFPKVSQPRVLWIGIEDHTGKLGDLQHYFEELCTMKGFTQEDRVFRPHFTIARTREANGARTAAELHQHMGFPRTPLLVKELIVFRSELNPQGSKYTALSRYSL